MQTSRGVRAAVERLKNFTCLQDIERVTTSRKNEISKDFLQVEIGIAGNREIFGWPGHELTAETPSELAAFGVFTTGDLYGHLKSLAADRIGIVNSVTEQDGEWVFHISVSLFESNYSVQGRSGSVKVEYDGHVWIDPANSRVLRVEVQPKGIPPASGMQRSSTLLTYESGEAGDFSAVPRQATTRVERWDGSTVVVRSQWHDCAAFVVESRLLTDDESDADEPAAPPQTASQWTAVRSRGIYTSLPEAVRLADLGVGAELPLRLDRPVELTDGSTLPAGTRVSARIVGLSPLPQGGGTVIAIRLQSYVGDGLRVAFQAASVRMAGPQTERFRRRTTPQSWQALLHDGRVETWTVENVFLYGRQRDAVLLLGEDEKWLTRPLRIEWENQAR